MAETTTMSAQRELPEPAVRQISDQERAERITASRRFAINPDGTVATNRRTWLEYEDR